MTYEELSALDKKTRMSNLCRIIIIPTSIILGIIVDVIIIRYVGTSLALWRLIAVSIPVVVAVVCVIAYKIYEYQLKKLESAALSMVGVSKWKYNKEKDVSITVKSRQATNIDPVKFFKADASRLPHALEVMKKKSVYATALTELHDGEEYKKLFIHGKIAKKIENNLKYIEYYYVVAHYSSPTGKSQVTTVLPIYKYDIQKLAEDKSILMSKTEYNRYLREQTKEQLEQKQHDYYEKVNHIIDLANENKDFLVNSDDAEKLDKLIASLFDRTVNSIKKIKSLESEEWSVIGKFISQIEDDVFEIVDKNDKILTYYESPEFEKIKMTCDSLMTTQRDFNEYIEEKVQSISALFGTRISRSETVTEDEYDYIHPYKKSITPFVAEVSSTVFASAENSPLEYVVKYFYPNKTQYPEQIIKLQTLIEELETLREAKQIIENYKADYQQYIIDVPDYVMEYDEDGFYSRLGFATIKESSLTVDYKFVYTSNAGKAQRSFTVPMTEETIVELINALQNKLSMSAFTKEQRSLMTSKLRTSIKERDNYTCKYCGNSIHSEPNLLLEVDHITPVSKGGYTTPENLQTLCWKCNRAKSAKIIAP